MRSGTFSGTRGSAARAKEAITLLLLSELCLNLSNFSGVVRCGKINILLGIECDNGSDEFAILVLDQQRSNEEYFARALL